jgi:uncharacterized membrane protein YvlD (DUF360 family)
MSTTGMAEIVLEQGGHLTADIISVTGERISVANETLQPQIRLLMLPVDKLAPGAYSLVVTVNGSLTAMPIVVTR